MRKAKIENGVVVNVALFNPDNMPEWAAEWVDAPGDVSAGDLFDGLAFTKPVLVVTSADVKAEAKARADTTQPADARLEMLAEFAAATLAHGADPALWPADVRSKVQAGVADWEKVKAIRAKAEQIAAMKTIPTDLKDERLWQADGKAV